MGREERLVEVGKAGENPHYLTNMRGLDFYDPDSSEQPKITIIGVGGIGSWAALALAKMGIKNIVLMDYDVVKAHNVGCTTYRKEDIGKLKVQAMKESLMGIVSNLDARPVKFIPTFSLHGLVISCVDSMATRKEIFEVATRANFLIDCRIGGELIRLFTCNPRSRASRKLYEKTLYTDENSVNLPCTGQNIAYVGLMAGAMITKEVQFYCGTHIAQTKEIIFNIAYPRLDCFLEYPEERTQHEDNY